MNPYIQYLVAAAVGYLLGSLNLAYLLGKRSKVDLRASGSGNLGASNTVLNLGLKAGIAVAIHDILKSYIAVLIAQQFLVGAIHAPYVAGCAAIVGHLFPFYLHFRGGKGFAPMIGFVVATSLQLSLALLVVCTALVTVTDYIVAATFTVTLALPIWVCWNVGPEAASIVAVASALVFVKHVENLRRIKAGTEGSVRKALKRK